jgi:hypothetical protein
MIFNRRPGAGFGPPDQDRRDAFNFSLTANLLALTISEDRQDMGFSVDERRDVIANNLASAVLSHACARFLPCLCPALNLFRKPLQPRDDHELSEGKVRFNDD